MRSRVITEAFLAEVAALYREALQNELLPSVTCAARLGASRHTAERWISKARTAGYLEPPVPGGIRIKRPQVSAPCSQPGCDTAAKSKGLCHKHYTRLRRTGSPENTKHSQISAVERFWASVVKTEDGCWGWDGHVGTGGYGWFNAEGRHHKASRFSYRLHHQRDPGHLFVLHRCDNPPCVRPDHLFLGTHRDNMIDMTRKGRGSAVPGERHPAARLSDAECAAMRALAARGWRCKEIAEAYGMSKTHTRNIIHNHRRVVA